jgi:NADH:ubiquinone oxidoreductase subunit F (NADH-binding)
MKHIKPKGYAETILCDDKIHTLEIVVSEKRHYCNKTSSCKQCHRGVRFWCKVISRIEKHQNQIIADNRLNGTSLEVEG